MAVIVRYRIEVKSNITVEQRFKWLFGNTEVSRGQYDITMDTKQIRKERDIQELVRLFKGDVSAKIIKTALEGL